MAWNLLNLAIQLALAVLVAAPCVLLLMGPGFLLFFEDMAGRPERGISRFALIRDAWTQFTQHPILGGGIGSFVDMEGTIVHNTTLWFLADFGIPGFAVLLGFLGWFLFAGWFAYGQAPLKDKPIVLALLMGHTVMLGLSMGIEAFYQRHWWVVFALIASCFAIGRRQARMRAIKRSECRPITHCKGSDAD